MVLLLGACSSASTDSTTTTDGPTATSLTTTTRRSAPTTTPFRPGRPAPDEEPLRTDHLAFANGAIVVSTSGLTGNADASALSIIDGSDEQQRLVEAAAPEVTIVVALPSSTVFDRFAVPGATEPPSDDTMFRTIVIEGSADGPAGPWELLAETELQGDLEVVEMTPVTDAAVSWIRLSLMDGVEESDTFVFSELVGNGDQQPVVSDERFSGTWDIRPFDGLDSPGRPLYLVQSGSVLSGCLGNLVVTGTVDGAVARALAAQPGTDRGRALLFVSDDDGELLVAITDDANRIEPRRGLPSTAGPTCDAPDPEPPSCGSTVHILFDVNSAEVRRDSERVLDDLFAGLGSASASSITIIGHTSTEGDEAYNQDLSERRAAAVVDELVARGFDPDIITSEGRGETEPLLVPDDDEASRSLNRRVEVSCTP